nr:bestrophin-3-like isoform X1 [Procambarus clarkii]XP_045607572.1 bestrophin-3-like isoform X1 [Procambarus clarkii]XP_045607582.1 bestrophin-3-like isoform X1 [Procambarus clarkii]XP_045607591.1 bestrophin-3-like isoform X1 [Procambarus clarkii]XP_045607600.1 bestrophin-3-like isoform X1 [Procambarus clarkii]XP_045607610.1 bestrophin-3-like isoform X1 [Procambarus clarkii]
MVVTYTNKIANLKGFGSFCRLLIRWRGSVYKMVWQDMLIYILLFYAISFLYRFGLNENDRLIFEKVSIHCGHFRNLIPISFVLGFYVSLIVSRWWGMYNSIPWPDTLCIYLATHIQGTDPRARMMRCTVVRYVNLAILMTFALIAPGVKKNFPGYQQLVDAGYMTDNEKAILESLERKTKEHKTYVTFMWASKLVDRARREGKIRDDIAQKTITDELIKIRGFCGELLGWDTYNIPLVYTQVVTIAVYSFFLFSVLGEQFLDPNKNYPNNIIDLYVPIFSLLQFFFYIGWLKVAESLINPFGEDDHDFEFVALIKRHLEMSYLLADASPQEYPTMVQDGYWDATLEAQNEKNELTNSAFILANRFVVQPDEVVKGECDSPC